jgi:ABC-type sugar transport system ATPase subunit
VSAPPAPLLELRGVSKRFAGVQALREVDLHLAAGEVHALVGENGAGKPSLFQLLTPHRRGGAARLPATSAGGRCSGSRS